MSLLSSSSTGSSGSAPAGTTACAGMSGATSAYCEPYQKCCAGFCCSSDQVCRVAPTPTAGYTGALPSYCADDWLEGMGGIRVVLIPAVCVVVVILGMALIYRSHLDKKLITFPAAVASFACLLIMFSPNWPIALLVSLSCFFSVAAVHNGKTLHALIVQIIVLAIFLGGLGLGALFVRPQYNFFPALDQGGAPAPGSSTKANIDAMQARCAQYYNFFWKAGYTAWNYDTSPSKNYWGYCSQEWLATVQFFMAVVLGSYFLLMVGTLHRYANKE